MHRTQLALVLRRRLLASRGRVAKARFDIGLNDVVVALEPRNFCLVRFALRGQALVRHRSLHTILFL